MRSMRSGIPAGAGMVEALLSAVPAEGLPAPGGWHPSSGGGSVGFDEGGLMSALLFALRQDRIVILSDTKASACPNMAKTWPIPHLLALVAGRGPAGLSMDGGCPALCGVCQRF
jgi:hypothetical protein